MPPPPTPRPVVTFQPPQQQQQQQEQVTGSANTNTNTGATCGDGDRGNGLCSNPSECCSQYGHCGTTPAHCDYGVNNNNNGLPPSFNTNANTNTASGGVSNNGIAGTCGGGLVGNGKCPNPVECCSQYGFCGTTPDHCAVSSQQAGQPIGQPTSVVQTPQFNEQGVLVPVNVNVNTPKTPEVYGSCGGGNTGNGICPNNSECCSQHGFCGT